MNKNIKIFTGFNPFRFLGLTGLLALSISVVIDTVMGIHNPYTLVPFVHIVTYFVNAFSMILCILIIIFPSQKKYTLIVVLVESLYTVLIGYE